MQSRRGIRMHGGYIFMLALIVLFFVPSINASAQEFQSAGSQSPVETLVMIRHGESAVGGLGQLDCQGLNRSLALPDVLLSRFGKPDYIYAPNPSEQLNESGTLYSYVRPLATIEPTAIRADLPVNTQIGESHIAQLQKELTQPGYANAHIFVAWEHVMLNKFAQNLMKAYGADPSVIPPWPGSDFDTIYVFQITRPDGKPHIEFRLEQERLTGTLSGKCPDDGTTQR